VELEQERDGPERSVAEGEEVERGEVEVEEPGLLPAEGSPIRYVEGVSGTEISREEYERLIQEEISASHCPSWSRGATSRPRTSST
jgi:hypothetical protein